MICRERGTGYPAETTFEALRHYFEHIGYVEEPYFKQLEDRSSLSTDQIAELRAIAEQYKRIGAPR